MREVELIGGPFNGRKVEVSEQVKDRLFIYDQRYGKMIYIKTEGNKYRING